MMSLLSHIRPAQAVRCTPLLRSSSHVLHSLSSSPLLTSTHMNLHPGHAQRRSIHIIQAAQDVILTIHSVTGTSWALTIPLVAAGVNLLFRFPFSIYNQRIIQRQHRAAPVLQAWSTRIMQDVQRSPSPREKIKTLAEKRFKKEVSRVYSALGLQRWKLYSPWLGVPFWLLGIEGVRRLCGASKGLLGTLLGDGAADQPTPPTASDPLPSSTSSSIPVGEFGGAASGGESTLSSDIVAMSDMASNTAHGLSTEGMLWFTDLTAADPYQILPFAVSAMMFLSVFSADKSATLRLRRILSNRKDPALSKEESMIRPEPSTRGAFRRLVLVLCLMIGPITLHLPAAVHLYWLTSTVSIMASRVLLDRWMPITKGVVKRCKGTRPPFIRPKILKRDPAKTTTVSAGS